jgi:hypothetical protein
MRYLPRFPVQPWLVQVEAISSEGFYDGLFRRKHPCLA